MAECNGAMPRNHWKMEIVSRQRLFGHDSQNENLWEKFWGITRWTQRSPKSKSWKFHGKSPEFEQKY